MLEPCGHMVTCEGCSKLIKKCIKCREQIERKSTYNDHCNQSATDLALNQNSSSNLSSSNSFSAKKTISTDEDYTGVKDMKKLQQQLHDIKEHVIIYKT